MATREASTFRRIMPTEGRERDTQFTPGEHLTLRRMGFDAHLRPRGFSAWLAHEQIIVKVLIGSPRRRERVLLVTIAVRHVDSCAGNRMLTSFEQTLTRCQVRERERQATSFVSKRQYSSMGLISTTVLGYELRLSRARAMRSTRDGMQLVETYRRVPCGETTERLP